MSKKLKWSLYIGFIAAGIISSIIGPLLPTIRTDIKMNYSQAGLLLSGQFVGMLLTSILGGYLTDRFGKKPFLITGGGFLLVGLVGSMFSAEYLLLYIFNLITGVGFGMYEVGINALCADYSSTSKGNEMNVLHSFYGIGAISGPILATFCIEYLNNWRLTFGLSALLPIVVTLILLNSDIKHHPLIKVSKDSPSSSKNPFKSLFLWASGFAVFFYVGVEVSTSGWLPEFWKSTAPNSFIPASLATTVFWIAITLGRIFSGKIADHIGLMQYLIYAALGTMLLSLLWCVMPFNIWMLFNILIIGFFLSGQFPTLMALATSGFPGRSGIIAAFISVFAALGGFIVPPLIGRIADAFDIRILSTAVLFLSIFLVSFMLLVKKGLSSVDK